MRSPAPTPLRASCSIYSLLLVACALSTAALAQSAFVRVNQVGYVSGAAKRAYLMSSGAETGATFTIKNSSGSTVFGPAAIGANLGSWSSSYPDIYALDFDSIMAAECNYLVSLGANCTLNGSTSPAVYAGRQLANVLGGNAWGTSLILDDGSTFPVCMQHQVTNLVPTPPNGPPFLSGAAVEGPNSASAKGTLSGMLACPPNGVDVFAQFNSKAVYKDFVQSYSTVEPAIDLTASSSLAFS